MPKSPFDIAVLMIVVLPGFVAYRFALARRAEIHYRSAIWQLVEMLEYSVYVHIVCVALSLTIALGLKHLTPVDIQLFDLPRMGLDQYVSSHSMEAIISGLIYSVAVIVVAILMGAYDFPHWFTDRVTGSVGWLSAKWNRIPNPKRAFPEEPIWYRAFPEARMPLSRSTPYLLVKMKSGDIYYGALISYPMLPDTENEKDFLITRARFYPNGDLNDENILEDAPGGGRVLLNTSDVDSIQIYSVSDETDQIPNAE